MKRMVFVALLAAVGFLSSAGALAAEARKKAAMPFVMQLTEEEGLQQRRAFLQIAKVLEDLGPDKVRIEVVTYEGGILSLLANNADTATRARASRKYKASPR